MLRVLHEEHLCCFVHRSLPWHVRLVNTRIARVRGSPRRVALLLHLLLLLLIQRAHRHLVLACILVGSGILGIDEATLDKVLARSRFSRPWNVILVGDLVELTHCLNTLGSGDLISLWCWWPLFHQATAG